MKRFGGGERLAAENDVEVLPDDRDEVEVEGDRGRPDSEARVGLAAGHRHGDLQVGAGVRPRYRGRWNSGLGQQPVKEYAGAGARLAPRDPQGAQVARPCDVAGIARGDQQALLAAPQMDDRRLPAAEQRTGERAVAGAGTVPQVDRRGVRRAAPEPGQAVEAAAGSRGEDVGFRLA